MTREEQEKIIYENVPKVYEAGRGSIKNEVANALKGSASGEVVALKDVSPLEHGLGVRVSSKNLLDLSPIIGKKVEANGASIICNADGSITASGTPTGYISFSSFRIDVPRNVDLVFSASGTFTNINATISTYNDKNEIIKSFSVSDAYEKININMAYDVAYVIIDIKRRANDIEMSGTAYFQLKKGKTTTAYTPFVPDVGAVKLRAQGANIINITEMLNNQLVDNGDGTYTLTKNGSSGLRFANWANINIPKGTKVAVNIDFIEIDLETTGTILGVQFMSDDGNIDTSINLAPQNVPRSFYFSTKNLTKARFFLSADKKDGDYVKFKNFQLEYGTANTEHEPYIEPVEYAVSADGTVEGVKSIYPSTTLTTDTVGALIEVDYNRDINKAFEELHKVILSLGGIL